MKTIEQTSNRKPFTKPEKQLNTTSNRKPFTKPEGNENDRTQHQTENPSLNRKGMKTIEHNIKLEILH